MSATPGRGRLSGPRRLVALWCAMAQCVFAAGCSGALEPASTDTTADSTAGEPAIEAPEPPDPATSALIKLRGRVPVKKRWDETPAYEASSTQTVRISRSCNPVYLVRDGLTISPFVGEPVEGLAFDLVASDGTVLESSPVWFIPILVEIDPDSPAPEFHSGHLTAVLAHRSDWPAMRFRDGSEVLYETADHEVRPRECPPDAPRVEFIWPPPGQTVRQGETVEVSWTVNGLDGDKLYTLFLLDGSGSTLLARQQSESSYQFDIGDHEKIVFKVIAEVEGEVRDVYEHSAIVRVEAR